MIAKERQNGHNTTRADVERKFILEDGELLDVFGEALEEV